MRERIFGEVLVVVASGRQVADLVMLSADGEGVKGDKQVLLR